MFLMCIIVNRVLIKIMINQSFGYSQVVSNWGEEGFESQGRNLDTAQFH